VLIPHPFLQPQKESPKSHFTGVLLVNGSQKPQHLTPLNSILIQLLPFSPFITAIATTSLNHILQQRQLSQIRRQLQRMNHTPIITHNQDVILQIETNMRQTCLLRDLLSTQWFTLVLSEIKYVDFAVGGDGSEYGGGVGRPADGGDGVV
jgi:hypothetical protein